VRKPVRPELVEGQVADAIAIRKQYCNLKRNKIITKIRLGEEVYIKHRQNKSEILVHKDFKLILYSKHLFLLKYSII